MRHTVQSALLAAICILASCTIKNDIDAPVVPGYITEFQISGQVSSDIDRQSLKVTVTLPEGTDLTALQLTRFRLSENAACDDMQEGSTIDLSKDRKITVRTYQEYIWTISATVRAASEIEVNARARRAFASSDVGDGGGTYRFLWKKAGSDNWIQGPEVTAESGTVSSVLTNLDPDSGYVVKLASSVSETPEVAFSTESDAQLPNMSLDEWCSEAYSSSKTYWYPGPAESEGRIWDSANKGILSVGKVCATTPEGSFTAPGGEGGNAARMESLFPNIFGIGRFAAGTLLTGKFGKAVGSLPNIGAQMQWGVPFSSRPDMLEGYYAYSPKTIDHDDLGKNPDKIGTTDEMQILVMLTDWDEPFLVDTSEGVFVDMENDSHIIAIGLIESSAATTGSDGEPEYVKFSCPLTYRDSYRIPKYVVVNACSSRFGDDFTGAVGSLLYVDELSFVYSGE